MTKEQQQRKMFRENMENYQRQQKKLMEARVNEQELSARSWKAHYEKMYYTIESEKIKPEYELLQAKIQKEAEEERARQEAEAKKSEPETKVELEKEVTV